MRVRYHQLMPGGRNGGILCFIQLWMLFRARKQLIPAQ
jgi:hypothetical protein